MRKPISIMIVQKKKQKTKRQINPVSLLIYIDRREYNTQKKPILF